MATTKITITLPDDQIHSIRDLVAAGKAGSVSAFVKHAVAVGLFDAAGWQEMLKDALRQTGGSLTKDEHKWADALLHPPEQGSRRKKASCMKGITFDAGGLIALDRDDRRVIVLLARANDLGVPVIIPATALAQVIRNPARQARLARIIRQASTELVPLNGPDAIAVGLLLAETATADIVDAHVVICARRTGQVVVTSDPQHIRRIDPKLRLVAV